MVVNVLSTLSVRLLPTGQKRKITPILTDVPRLRMRSHPTSQRTRETRFEFSAVPHGASSSRWETGEREKCRYTIHTHSPRKQQHDRMGSDGRRSNGSSNTMNNTNKKRKRALSKLRSSTKVPGGVAGGEIATPAASECSSLIYSELTNHNQVRG